MSVRLSVRHTRDGESRLNSSRYRNNIVTYLSCFRSLSQKKQAYLILTFERQKGDGSRHCIVLLSETVEPYSMFLTTLSPSP